jgi:hypothetical protein
MKVVVLDYKHGQAPRLVDDLLEEEEEEVKLDITGQYLTL